MKRTARWMARGLTAAALGLSLSMPATAQEDTDLALLLKEAGVRNPESSAVRRAAESAACSVKPAVALDDTMLVAGLLNVPAQSLDLRQENMTMIMIGISQRLPYPGKRALLRGDAQKEAEAVAVGVQ